MLLTHVDYCCWKKGFGPSLQLTEALCTMEMADWIRGIINFNVVFHAGKQDNSLVIYYP
jgi:hypothetical protein